MASETSKYRHLTTKFCKGNGLDIGSQNDPVVPWAVSMDLPHDDYKTYSSGQAPENSIQWRADCRALPFKDGVCDFVYSSHLLEDFFEWGPVLTEWKRVLKPGGFIVILVPDRKLWNEAIAKGQPPNCAHTHESFVGELTTFFPGYEIVHDSLTEVAEGDYSILFVARKPS